MSDGNGAQGKPVLRSYKFPLSELTNARTCSQLEGGFIYLSRLVHKQDWKGGTLAIVVEVVQPKGEEAYLEVTQEIEEGQLLLPLGGDTSSRAPDSEIPGGQGAEQHQEPPTGQAGIQTEVAEASPGELAQVGTKPDRNGSLQEGQDPRTTEG
jgi:hypothetical protein